MSVPRQNIARRMFRNQKNQINAYRLLRSRGMSRNQAVKATGLTYKSATEFDEAEKRGGFRTPLSELADLIRKESSTE